MGDIENFIVSTSRGLLEVSANELPYVQFIYESVQEFFLETDNVARIFSSHSSNFLGMSHRTIAKVCVVYIRHGILENVELEPLPMSNKKQIVDTVVRDIADKFRRFPFTSYALLSAPYHASLAKQASIPISDTFTGLSPRRLVRLARIATALLRNGALLKVVGINRPNRS
ncbi:hypothetical protein F4677DRAFT_30236 [Hypoxylon crocopeplum]|nr:hypothetical protein F4677DRAFT_30236 [Hypoxylon crocopeplum]